MKILLHVIHFICENADISKSMVSWKSFKDMKPSDCNVGVKCRCIRSYSTFAINNPEEIISHEAIFHDEEVKNTLLNFTVLKCSDSQNQKSDI